MFSDVAGCASISNRRCTFGVLLKSKSCTVDDVYEFKTFLSDFNTNLFHRSITTGGAFNYKAIDLIKRKNAFAHCNYTSIS